MTDSRWVEREGEGENQYLFVFLYSGSIIMGRNWDDLGQKCPIQPQQFTIHFGQWDMNYSGLYCEMMMDHVLVWIFPVCCSNEMLGPVHTI